MMRNYEREIYIVMKDLGAPQNLKGYKYVSFAVNAMMTGVLASDEKLMAIYYVIAEKFNTTPMRVERAIRHFVERCFDVAPPFKLSKYFGENIVPVNKDKPTNGAFLYAFCEYLKFNEVRDSE